MGVRFNLRRTTQVPERFAVRLTPAHEEITQPPSPCTGARTLSPTQGKVSVRGAFLNRRQEADPALGLVPREQARSRSLFIFVSVIQLTALVDICHNLEVIQSQINAGTITFLIAQRLIVSLITQ